MSKKASITKRILLFLLAAIILTGAVPVSRVASAKERKIVKVGFFESSFNQMAESGKLTGYAYEYLQEIAGYTGWKYEYVIDTWENLMYKLENGEIDIISDVSYLPEREDKMLFSEHSMGNERFFLYTTKTMLDAGTDALAEFLEGKSVGVSAYSIERDIFVKWCENHNIHTHIVEFSGDDTLARALQQKEIVALVATDAFISLEEAEPVVELGASEIYFALNKQRPDLKKDIDFAMERIEKNDPYFVTRLNEKYIISGTGRYISAEEAAWLEKHQVIKIGYRDDYLAFCATDPNSGNLVGALKDYIVAATQTITNANLHFETIPFPNTDAAIAALKKGEIDCLFPISLDKYDAESNEMLVTKCVMKSDIYAVVRKDRFSVNANNTAAVDLGNSNYDTIVSRFFPSWTVKEYVSTSECLKGISSGEADCLLLSNYRINSVSSLINEYDLTTVATGYVLEYSFAMNRESTELYGILNRIITLIPESGVYTSLAEHSIVKARVSFRQFVKDNMTIVIMLFVLVIVIILYFLYRSLKTAKEAKLQKARLQEALDNYKQADYDRRTDFLTGLHNRQDMFEFLQDSLSGKREKIIAMYMMDIDNFKSFNDNFGHSAGDDCLRRIGHALKEYGASHDIVFYRYGGEEMLGISFSKELDAHVVADEIVKLVYDLNIERNDVPLGRATISLGYTCDNRRYEKMIDKADTAMYKAKSKGKNQSCSYEQLIYDA